MNTWEINGLSLELDLGDADVMERYENAFEEMAKEENTIPKEGRQSERIRFTASFSGIFMTEFSVKALPTRFLRAFRQA